MNIGNRGIRPYMVTKPDHKSSIWETSLPHEAIIPLLQHQGREAQPLVRVGDQVHEGQLIGEAANGTAVHASIPGVVQAITTMRLPGDTMCQAVKITLAGQFNYTGKNVRNSDWGKLTPRQLIKIISEKGLVQLDGSAQDLARVFRNCQKFTTKTVIVNAASGTPFLSSETRILEEYPEHIVEAIRIIQHILKPRNIIFACTRPAQNFLEAAAGQKLRIKVKHVQEIYPAGNAQRLMQSLSHKAASEQQALICNISTLLALYDGIVLRKALIDKIITVGGGALKASKTIKARLGTPLGIIFREVGGMHAKPAKIVVGIPLQGHEIQDSNAPITKQITSVFALCDEEIGDAPQIPCIHCGSCVDHCPANLEPVTLHKLLSVNKVDKALEQGLQSCWLCGICSHVCPSHIPLTAIMRDGIIKAQKGNIR